MNNSSTTTDRQLDADIAEQVLGWRLKILGAMRDADCGGLYVCADCGYGPPDWAGLGMEPDPEWQHRRHHSEELCYQESHVWRVVPEFSTEIAAAWLVVEHLRARGWEMDLSMDRCGWTCAVWHNRPFREAIAAAETAPEAVCRAALKTVEDAP